MKKVLLSIFFILFTYGISFSQSYPLQIRATVISPISVTTTDLNFGDVMRGINKSIVPGNSGSGKWEITGASNKEVQFSFVVPTYISSGSNELAFTSGSNGGKYSTDPSGTPGTSFFPLSTITTTLSSTGKLYIFIGGTVSPLSNQASGEYSGNITLSIQYTGN